MEAPFITREDEGQLVTQTGLKSADEPLDIEAFENLRRSHPDLFPTTWDDSNVINDAVGTIVCTPDISQRGEEICSLPEKFVVSLPCTMICEPMNNAYPTIEVSVYAVMNHKIASYDSRGQKIETTEFVMYGTLETSPMLVDPASGTDYNRYKTALMMTAAGIRDSTMEEDQKEEYLNSLKKPFHFTRWGAPRYWAGLCFPMSKKQQDENLMDDVRIKIFNNLCKATGGFQYYPFDFSRIVWVRPHASSVNILLNPALHGYMVVQIGEADNVELQLVPGIDPRVNNTSSIPAPWKNRGGVKLLNPDFKNGRRYALFELRELLPVSKNTQFVSMNLNYVNSNLFSNVLEQVEGLVSARMKQQMQRELEQAKTKRQKRGKTTRKTRSFNDASGMVEKEDDEMDTSSSPGSSPPASNIFC